MTETKPTETEAEAQARHTEKAKRRAENLKKAAQEPATGKRF
jgi:hypothetical protein